MLYLSIFTETSSTVLLSCKKEQFLFFCFDAMLTGVTLIYLGVWNLDLSCFFFFFFFLLLRLHLCRHWELSFRTALWCGWHSVAVTGAGESTLSSAKRRHFFRWDSRKCKRLIDYFFLLFRQIKSNLKKYFIIEHLFDILKFVVYATNSKIRIISCMSYSSSDAVHALKILWLMDKPATLDGRFAVVPSWDLVCVVHCGSPQGVCSQCFLD